MAYGTVNADVIGTSVAGSNLGAGNASIMKNRIINGAMVIDQRNAGASVTPTTIGNNYTLDRWTAVISQASKISVQQNAGSVTPPVGFKNYLGVTSLATTSLGASDYFTITQYIEGYNIADLGWGTANAKTVTLSFQVYSSLTGTFGGAIENYAQTRSYPFTYTISSANTWTTVSVTVAGDTSGTYNTNNSGGISIYLGLGVGSTYSGTAGSWSGSTYISATGATSVVGTNGATFYITGVQLEVGSSATGFEYRLYNQELGACQRYYFRLTGTQAFGNGFALDSTNYMTIVTFPTTMRSAPTALEQSGTAGNYTIYKAPGNTSTCTSVPTFVNASTYLTRVQMYGNSDLTAGAGGVSQIANSAAYLGWSAEL